MNIRIPLILFFSIAFVSVCAFIFSYQRTQPSPLNRGASVGHIWQMKSIDTMKYSRDKALERLHDQSFDTVIEAQVKAIAQTGATHIAIATPYDKQFLPYLKRWVAIARKYNLNVWFRGNFSGWEGWFNYPKTLTRSEHIRMTREFISENPFLFENHDAFTACPECENGGPGDPRHTGDKDGHREFLIEEYNATNEEFAAIGKTVAANYNSMNFDVAKLIMDKATTTALGGIIAIDHYVNSPYALAQSVKELARSTGGKIFLGEFGAPLHDIHGDMSEDEQAAWIDEALQKLSIEPSVMGVSYWVGTGGSTAIWNDDGSPKKAVSVLRTYFSPEVVRGVVSDQYNNPIPNVTFTSQYEQSVSDAAGEFSVTVFPFEKNIVVSMAGHANVNYAIPENNQQLQIVIQQSPQSLIDNIKDFIYKKLN